MDTENGLLSVLGESLGPSGVAEASRELEESMGTTRHRYDDFKGRLFISKQITSNRKRIRTKAHDIDICNIQRSIYDFSNLHIMSSIPYFYYVLNLR
jgi:hypothetical protein